MKKQFDFDYAGMDGKFYDGRFLLSDENGKIEVESYSYLDPDTEEWVDCDRSDIRKSEISEAWENGTVL